MGPWSRLRGMNAAYVSMVACRFLSTGPFPQIQYMASAAPIVLPPNSPDPFLVSTWSSFFRPRKLILRGDEILPPRT